MFLPTETGEGDRIGIYAPCFLRSKKGKQTCGAGSAKRWPLTSPRNESFWSIRPNAKSTKNWIRTLVDNDQRCDSRLHFEWLGAGLTA